MLNLIKAAGLVVGFELIWELIWNTAYGLKLSSNHLSMEGWNSYPWVLAWWEWQTPFHEAEDFRCSEWLKSVEDPETNQCQNWQSLRPLQTWDHRDFAHSASFSEILTLNPSFSAYPASPQPSVSHHLSQECTVPWVTWDNLGQGLRKPHYSLYLSCRQVLFQVVFLYLDRLYSIFQTSCLTVWGGITP